MPDIFAVHYRYAPREGDACRSAQRDAPQAQVLLVKFNTLRGDMEAWAGALV